MCRRRMDPYLGGSCQSVSGFADTDVQAQFADPKITHNVLRLVTFDYVLISRRKENIITLVEGNTCRL